VKFTDINLFGVYVAPISVMMVAAWLIMMGLRRATVPFGLLQHVWHPSLFMAGVYVIILSCIVLIVAH
jgi:hypothetical protein